MRSAWIYCVAVALDIIGSCTALSVGYYGGTGCTSYITGSNKVRPCGCNAVPVSPTIKSYYISDTNGIPVTFYLGRACNGGTYFKDNGGGGCVTDSRAVVNSYCVGCPGYCV